MKKIKLGAVLMAALMLLTACSGGASSSTPVSEPASTANSSGSTSAAEPTENDWMTPFEETVTLDVVVGWDADATVKEGTTPETNALAELAKDMLNIELNFLWMVPNDQFEERLALQISSRHPHAAER